MSSKRLAKQRKAMWRLNPRCYYCGVVTILRPLHIPGQQLMPEIRYRVATLDHVRARHHPDRTKPPEPGEVLHVLACWRCNNERDQRELQMKPKEYLREQSGAIPLEERSLEEMESVLILLQARKPRRKDKRAKWQRNIEAVTEAIGRRKGDGPQTTEDLCMTQ